MKKSILIASFFLGTYAFAQTAEQRTVIQKSINKEELSLLETKFQVDYQKNYELWIVVLNIWIKIKRI